MKTRISIIQVALGLALLPSCAKDNFAGSQSDIPDTELNAKVIYGSDGRQDVYQSSPQLRQLAQSTVALVKTNQLISQGASTAILGKNFGQEMQLCATEKFREQSTAAFCSGSLVGPDTVITAGHCITNQSDCVSTSFVFGFAVSNQEILPSQVASTEVYRCREIIKQVLTSNGADFAVIKLDRTVTNHQPLQMRQTGSVQVGDPLVVIGHPSGLPTKVTVGGQVRSIASSDFFQANTDTYGGNSGSAVFNANTGLIEGILVRGERDYIPNGNCYASNICNDSSCRGEDITRISIVKDYIPQVSQPPVTPQPPANPPPVTPPKPPATTPEVFVNQNTLAIPDNNKTGVTSNLVVNSTPQGRKVSVSVNITHPYIGDLVVKLVASDGQNIVLHNRVGGSADNIVKTYDVTANLGKVVTKRVYKLVVQDLASQDTGSIKSWSIKFE